MCVGLMVELQRENSGDADDGHANALAPSIHLVVAVLEGALRTGSAPGLLVRYFDWRPAWLLCPWAWCDGGHEDSGPEQKIARREALFLRQLTRGTVVRWGKMNESTIARCPSARASDR